MTFSSAGLRSPLARKLYIIIGIILAALLVLYISARIFVAHAQSVANREMNYPCPRYLFNEHPNLRATTSDATRPDKCVHYLQTIYNINALSMAKKDSKDVTVLIAVDGVYTPATAQAIKSFQSGTSLKADGVVNGKTWTKLEAGAKSAK
jgi:peptidoglycan hydrolase-like protein with peptidoglycan-binding domain